MPRIISVKEVLYKELWHAWIADTRPDGLGMSKDIRIGDAIKLFESDVGYTHRTNAKYAGKLFPGHKASILKIGVFVSFSNKEHYELFFKSTNFIFLVNEESQIRIPSSDLERKKTFLHGSMHWIELPKPIKINEGDTFCGMIKFDEAFKKEMQAIENYPELEAYAEIKYILAGNFTRDIQ
jgi:hypothetical protein